jgi:hypothetical protein
VKNKHFERKIRSPIGSLWKRIEDFIKSLFFSSNWHAKRSLGELKPEWESRIEKVCKCPDNDFIKRVPNAGIISNGWITMHNGIKVSAMGYYGKGILNMLVRNAGVHEPEEERVFQEVLKCIKPGSTILEVGAYWAFYSLWFASEVKDAKCHMIEASHANILSGKKNFKKAGKKGVFFQAFVDKYTDLSSKINSTITIDHYCNINQIDHLEILHSDIQGAEANMLQGCSNMLKGRKIDFIFISTHSSELHRICKKFLTNFSYEIVVDIDLEKTSSHDGLLTYIKKGIAFNDSRIPRV